MPTAQPDCLLPQVDLTDTRHGVAAQELSRKELVSALTAAESWEQVCHPDEPML